MRVEKYMEKTIRAIVLKFPGTNCDVETAVALEIAGFKSDIIPIKILNSDLLQKYSLFVIPGGFSYGDYVNAGKLAALELELKLGNKLESYWRQGGILLGICNGFQILLQLNLLPESALTKNVNNRFICKWVKLKIVNRKNLFLKFLPDEFELPFAHGEGRFIARNNNAKGYLESGIVNLQYADNVNGSQYNIAGISDNSGRIFGLMAHPERFIYKENYYAPELYKSKYGWGYYFFKGAFEYCKTKLHFYKN